MSSSEFDARLNRWFDAVEPRQAPANLLPAVFAAARSSGQARGVWHRLTATIELRWSARLPLSPTIVLAIIVGVLILTLAVVGFGAGWVRPPSKTTMVDGVIAVQEAFMPDQPRQLMRFIDPLTGRDTLVTPGGIQTCGANFSPDGSRYALLYQEGGYQQGGDVFVAVAPTAGEFRPTKLLRKPFQVQFDPRWKPDGSALVATMEAGDGSYRELMVLPTDGTAAFRVTDVQASYAADWSPSGEWIAFVGVGPGHPLYVIRPNGRDLRLLRPHGVDAIAWSPVRDELAYSSSEDGQLHVIALDGAELFTMADGRLPTSDASGANIAQPVWSDDGTKIALAMANYPLEPAGVLRIFDIAASTSMRITLQGQIARAVWSAKGDALAAVAWTADGSSAGLWEVPINGAEPRLIADEVRPNCMSGGVALSWQRLRK